ncbi:DUF1629 domain-containing protein [uncultured Zobellia sp.]|uniref:imm11 family protein n=1 Tax=uncultured Zobellia sp. TaxID=255433 RepID=UPI0025932ADF|nr:DUF1629 domain-containing protein [uncultured Zobellia sp.]
MFKLNVALFNEYRYLEFVNQQNNIINFFTLNKGNDTFLNYTDIIFNAQKGFNLKNIRSFDYLEGFMDIHVFSERFKNSLETILKDEIIFYPCKVLCEDEKITFYIAKFIKYMDIINEEISEYSTFSDGAKKLEKPVFKEGINFNYAVRDSNELIISVVSNKFVELSKKNNFKISFDKLKVSV